MAHQWSTRVRNARLNIVEATIGASPTMLIRTGNRPANITDASTGTVLATIQLPADWMGDAAAGVKSKIGTWEDTSADATGIAGHYEIVGTGNVVDERGTITVVGGGGDMEVQNVNINAGQSIVITTKTYTDGNA